MSWWSVCFHVQRWTSSLDQTCISRLNWINSVENICLCFHHTVLLAVIVCNVFSTNCSGIWDCKILGLKVAVSIWNFILGIALSCFFFFLIQISWLWMLFVIMFLPIFKSTYSRRMRRVEASSSIWIWSRYKLVTVGRRQEWLSACSMAHVQSLMYCGSLFRYCKWLQFRRIPPPSQNKRSDHQWTDSETKILFYLQDFPPTSCLTLQPLR